MDTVKCTNCGWSGTEEDLLLIEADESDTITATENSSGLVRRRLPKPDHPQFFKGCPQCETDAYLSDINTTPANTVKQYKIPIVFQKIDYFDVEATTLQEAVRLALKQFFEKPEEGYLEDSYEVDGIIEDNYPDEEYDVDKALKEL